MTFLKGPTNASSKIQFFVLGCGYLQGPWVWSKLESENHAKRALFKRVLTRTLSSRSTVICTVPDIAAATTAAVMHVFA